MKVNKGLEKLCIPNLNNLKTFQIRETNLFREMIRENITLIEVRISGTQFERILREEIANCTQLNRTWKRYIVKKEEQKMDASAVIVEGTSAAINNEFRINNANNFDAIDQTLRNEEGMIRRKEEDNERKIFKIRMLLHTFMVRPRMRDTIIFIILSESFDVFDNDATKKTNHLYHMLCMLSEAPVNNTTTIGVNKYYMDSNEMNDTDTTLSEISFIRTTLIYIAESTLKMKMVAVVAFIGLFTELYCRASNK